ncbi:hypothetical protein [Kaarinaea lacus]
MKPIYKSRKFLIAVVDMIAGILALVVGRFMQPDDAQFVLQLWGYAQPVILVWIGAIAYEDGQAMKAGIHPQQKEE